MIYYVEDDDNIRGLTLYALHQQGIEAEGFSCDSEFKAAGAKRVPDAVLLDIMLPDTDGLEILRRLRSSSETATVPIMMLTAKDTELDKVVALDGGADDYLTKPFDIGEFLARVRALTRRSAAKQLSGLTCGNFTLDRASMELSCGTSSVCLSSREAAMLELFIREEGRLLTETQLLEHTWGSTSYDEGASDPLPPTQEAQLVWTYVSYLRKKMQALGANRSIQRTEEGYRLTAADA